MTLLLSEKDVESFLQMRDVVSALDEAFRRQAVGQASNSPRTRTRGEDAVLSAMHASLPYLGRLGLKFYVSSRTGTRFVFVLFNAADSTPLVVMGADMLGRFRTGAASGVATRYLYGKKSARLAICGSGGQALTQVQAVAAVTSVKDVRVWSPARAHRERFAIKLKKLGYDASPVESPKSALDGADVVTTITSSDKPFIEESFVEGVSHVNMCGSNSPERSEMAPEAFGRFTTVVVDDLPQAKVEYGDIIRAVAAGKTSWDRIVELKDVVGGSARPRGKTLFKSGGAALEDVAVGSMVYDRAMESGRFSGASFEFG